MKALENIKEIEQKAIMIVGTLESEKDSVIIPMSKSKFDRLIGEAIKELEALESRSCEGCKHEKEKIKLSKYNCNPYPCYECLRNASDRWEDKL